MKPASDSGTSPLTFGRYEALLRIGRGGMAEVYAGRVRGEAGFQKLVAIKRMLPHLAEDERFSAMFLDEARLAAHISSPYVVTTHDLGRADDGSLYLVMELVVGSTLSSFLRNAARHGTCVPLPISVEVLAQAAQGLHDAHDAKTPLGDPLEIVHRDVSPQNILVGVDGRARITDFGVARAMMRRSDTSTGELKGKLAYFSPEQVKDGALDRRSDIFALGIVAWETFTSRRLFKAENPLALLDRIMNMPIPSVRRFNPEVPESVDAAVQRALSRDLDERYPDGMAFAMALRSAYSNCGSRKDVSAYVRNEASDRIERMEDALRAALARGDQSSIPAPNDARSGITRRNQLNQLKRQRGPERPATDQTTAATDGHETRRLGTRDVSSKERTFDPISASPSAPYDDPSQDTLGDEDYDDDVYDDGPTFAMEQAPSFGASPIRDAPNPATQLAPFNEEAVALAAEPTVAVDPYDPSSGSQPSYEPVGSPFAQHSVATVSPQPSSSIPWKVIGLIAGVAIAIGLGVMSLRKRDEPPRGAPMPTADPFATASENVKPAPPQQDQAAEVEQDLALEAKSDQARDNLAPDSPERTSPEDLLKELQQKKAEEEAAQKKAEEEAAQKKKEEARRASSTSRKATTSTRRTFSSSPTKSTHKSSPSQSTKPTSKSVDDGRKHGRGGIRLDF